MGIAVLLERKVNYLVLQHYRHSRLEAAAID